MNYSKLLKEVIAASGWSQERLAKELGVSFPTLNSWINERSAPRVTAQTKIAELHIQVIGSVTVDVERLEESKKLSLALRLNVADIVKDKALLDRLTLHMTYHTNTIEGSTMTLADVQGVLFDNKVLSNRTAIEQLEARNHQSTLHWLLDQVSQRGKGFIVDEDVILSVHLRLMNGIVSDAGVYRKHAVRIMGSRSTLSNWASIPAKIKDLVAVKPSTYGDYVSYMAYFHAEFEKIHPFSDGNGRTGRLLLLAQALSVGLMPPIVTKERKRAYYRYLERAQTVEKYDGLELFVAESMTFANESLFEN